MAYAGPRDGSEQLQKQRGINGEGVKSIFIVQNGDVFSPKKKFVLNKRATRTWDVFLDQMTSLLKPRTGSIRDIHSSRGGRKVLGFDQLLPAGSYVAVPFGERPKKIHYPNLNGDVIVDKNGNPKKRKSPPSNGSGSRLLEPIQPVIHSRLRTDGRIRMEMEKRGKNIYVYRNGDEFTRAFGVLLSPFEQTDMELVLRAIDQRVILPNNKPIRKLYTIGGVRMKSPRELEEGKYYVAASGEHFIMKPYGSSIPIVTHTKLRKTDYEGLKYLNNVVTPPKSKIRPLYDLTPRRLYAESQNEATHIESVRQRAPEHQYYGDFHHQNDQQFSDYYDYRQRDEPSRHLDDQIHHVEENIDQPSNQTNQAIDFDDFGFDDPKPIKEVNFDDSRNGVFHAHGENAVTEGAQELQETTTTAIDVPIDQQVAETVEEEVITRREEPENVPDVNLNTGAETDRTDVPLKPEEPTVDATNPRRASDLAEQTDAVDESARTQARVELSEERPTDKQDDSNTKPKVDEEYGAFLTDHIDEKA